MKRLLPALAIAALALPAPAIAQDDWHPVTPDSNWAITDSTCVINGSWIEEVQLVINRHLDHYDLGYYNNKIKKLAHSKLIAMQFGINNDAGTVRDYQAIGYKDEAGPYYVTDIDLGLLDWMAVAETFQLYRDKTLLDDLNMTGFAPALRAMRDCEARLPAEEIGAGGYTAADWAADGDAAAAVDAANAAAQSADGAAKVATPGA